MGKFSRAKGMRNEYLLRDSLRAEGFKADRVPSSGAAQGFKGDIRFYREGEQRMYTAELKARRDEFKRIYELYAELKKLPHFQNLPVSVCYEGNKLLSMHETMATALEGAQYYPNWGWADSAWNRTMKKLFNMQKLLQTSDVLVIKDDRKPFLYIRYR